MKKYYNIKDIDIKEVISEIENEYDISIKFRKMDDGFNGRANFESNTIFINQLIFKDKSWLLQCIFHELGHFYCYRNGIYKSYHIRKHIPDMTPEEKKAKIRVGIKAEKWVDKWAEIELKKWFPRLKYVHKYSMPENIKKYKNKYLSLFREFNNNI